MYACDNHATFESTLYYGKDAYEYNEYDNPSLLRPDRQVSGTIYDTYRAEFKTGFAKNDEQFIQRIEDISSYYASPLEFFEAVALISFDWKAEGTWTQDGPSYRCSGNVLVVE